MAQPITNHTFRTVSGTLQRVPVELQPLKSNEVRLRITHSGLCHSDILYLNSGIALGHEAVGIVEEIGSSVTKFKIGDRAGGGYLRNSCGKCKYCLTGREIWCYERDIYGEASFDTGGFADYFVGEETYLHKIPEEISSADAAPLQCAGVTVYQGMINVVKPGHRVGVIGIGGLGHLAIQYAAHLGAEVIVFSTSASKETEARGFGASEFYLLGEPEKIIEPLDVLVLTGSGHPDFGKFLTKNILARDGTIIPLTASFEEMKLPTMKMFFDGYHIHSSLVANRQVHDDALRFAAKHGIRPAVREFALNLDGFNKAVKELEAGHVRYRAVLVKE